jgi:hypothetical protein
LLENVATPVKFGPQKFPAGPAAFFRQLWNQPSRFEWWLIVLGVIHIVSTAYLGLHGHVTSVWRQSDVYAHILGFLGREGLSPARDFLGKSTLYDIPFYQLLVASLARIGHLSPLVATRLFNAFLYVFTLLLASRFVKQFSAASGPWVCALFLISPFFAHYYTVPLPDLLGISLSLLVLLAWLEGFSLGPFFLAAWGVAVAIKSPVAFVFLIFAICYWLIGYLSASPRLPLREFLSLGRPIAILSLEGLIIALLAEKMRSIILSGSHSGFAQDPSWYFGTIQQRVDPAIYLTAFSRHLVGGFTVAIPKLLLALLILGVPALVSARLDRRIMAMWLSILPAVAIPWAVFTNLYAIHDYYQLPGQVLLVCGFAVSFGFVFGSRGILERVGRTSYVKLAILISLALSLYRVPSWSRLQSLHPMSSVAGLVADREMPIVVYNQHLGDLDPSTGGLTSHQVRLGRLDELRAICRARGGVGAAALPRLGLIYKSMSNNRSPGGEVVPEDCKEWLKDMSRSWIDHEAYLFWSR